MSLKTEQDMKSGINEHREHCQDEPPDVYAAEAALGIITVPEKKQESCYARSPQPSSDPNDPLNWPGWEKYANLATICFYTFLATVNASNFAPGTLILAKSFHKPVSHITYFISFNTLMLGAGNLFWVPLMRKVGKRLAYLMAIFLLMVFNIWSYEAKSFSSLLAARILSGFAAAAGDAPVPALIAEMFFAHERGFALMFFHLALSCGVFIGPLINSYVIQDTKSWQWTCGWIAVAAGVNWLAALFLVHETAYHKRDVTAPTEAFGPKRKFLANMSVTIGFNKQASFFQSLKDILSIAVLPPVVWGGILVGVFTGWNIVVSLEASVLFLHPPYRWQIHSLGLLNLAGLLGTLSAIFFGGRLIDIIANSMTKRNRGRREPEYRLPALILPAIIGPMGILLFGLCAANKKPWIGAAFAYAMQAFGLTAASNILATYAVDSYHGLAGEALVFFFVVRASLGCILSLFTFDWIAKAGTANAFGQMVGIQYFVLLFAPLFYFKGKQIRTLGVKQDVAEKVFA